MFHISGRGSAQKEIPEITRLLWILGHPKELGMSIMEHLVKRTDNRRSERDNLLHRRIIQQEAAHMVRQTQHVGRQYRLNIGERRR